ncbi:hypothetical protein VNI00_019044 [Paramarasmius palmivorus]|uniref:NACHT domain-containing protein n=1 Tax=Paramarasmius palmivorus TaxID=297713 RepID=A0AAW0AS75_9AGAR
MVIHKRKSRDDRFELSLKMEHFAFSPGRSTLTSTAAASESSEQQEHAPPAVEDLQDAGTKTDGDSASLEDKIEKLKVRTEKRKRIYQTADTVIETLNQLSEAIKAKHEQDEAIVALYDIMIETYNVAIENNALNAEGDFSALFDRIVSQSQECYIFLSSCIIKGNLCRVMDHTSLTIADLKGTFEQLKEEFFKSQVKVTTMTVLQTHRAVRSMGRKETLRILESSAKLLRPKSHCLLGTRRSSLAKILEWCFHGEQSILWISGIAGCGKSSLIGTLHNSLSELGFNSRLAAFIRFDRNDYNDAGEFVKTLAFLLAEFDERFGKLIAEVVERSRQIAQNTNLSMQVQKLLINPLQGLSEDIAKEGRIVVLVDGIDESSQEDRAETKFREQLLELFADDRFKLLPFLRFVLASRPEEDIVRSLQHCSHIHHFPLDHTSPETTNDIHYFLTKSFQHSSFDGLDNSRKHTAIERLTEHASGLFIWAATAITFIRENVEQRLEAFVEQEPPKNALQALTSLYKIALQSLVKEDDDDIQQNICTALGLIMANANSSESDPCSVDILHALTKYVNLGNNAGILSAFQKLRSLVTEENEHYQLLHKSFDDFLTSEDRAHRWYIDLEKYNVILAEAILTCMMDHLDKTDAELPEALSSDVYEYASVFWLPDHASASYQMKEGAFLLGYLLRWMCSLDHEFSGGTFFGPQRIYGGSLTENGRHDSEFMQKAITGASRLGEIDAKPIVIKDFFNIMLYDAALAGKVTKTNTDGQYILEWEIDNIYMSVFVLMAGSSIYEEIVAVLDTNPIPLVVPLDPETEMPIKIVSQGKIRMNHSSVVEGDEKSTKEFIEWIPGRYGRREGIIQWIPDEAEEEDSEPSSSESRNSESEE